MIKNSFLFIIDASNVDLEQLEALQPVRPAVEAVAVELMLNIDFYIGFIDYSINIIDLKNNIKAVLLSFDDDIKTFEWFISALTNINSFIDILAVIE